MSAALSRIVAALTRQGAVPLDITLGWVLLGIGYGAAMLCLAALLLWGQT